MLSDARSIADIAALTPSDPLAIGGWRRTVSTSGILWFAEAPKRVLPSHGRNFLSQR